MRVPILVVLADSGIDFEITALRACADGYLTKPFDRFELVANLDAIIRRTHGHSSPTVKVGNFIVDLSRNYAKIDDARLDLTKRNSASLNI